MRRSVRFALALALLIAASIPAAGCAVSDEDASGAEGSAAVSSSAFEQTVSEYAELLHESSLALLRSEELATSKRISEEELWSLLYAKASTMDQYANTLRTKLEAGDFKARRDSVERMIAFSHRIAGALRQLSDSSEAKTAAIDWKSLKPRIDAIRTQLDAERQRVS